MTDSTTNSVWLKTDSEIINSLLADEAKQQPMLTEALNTIKQLQAKNRFRLALLNQLLANKQDK